MELCVPEVCGQSVQAEMARGLLSEEAPQPAEEDPTSVAGMEEDPWSWQTSISALAARWWWSGMAGTNRPPGRSGMVGLDPREGASQTAAGWETAVAA